MRNIVYLDFIEEDEQEKQQVDKIDYRMSEVD